MTQTNVVENSLADFPSISVANEDSFKCDHVDNSRIITIEQQDLKSETEHYTVLLQGVNNLSMEQI